MVQSSKAYAGFAVKDLEIAKKFYQDILGLEVSERGDMDLIIHLASGTNVFVYAKGKAHEPANFTVLYFPVDDLDATVDDLISKGVVFEQYHTDMLETDKKGIMRTDNPEHGPDIAWFTDPSGNIFAVTA